MKLKCFKCENIWECNCTVEATCPYCGSTNIIPTDTDVDVEEDWLQCLEPEGFEWSMPSGKKGNPVTGYTYVAANGDELTKNEYLDKYKMDPDVALEYMRKNRGVIYASHI